ncbi:TetR/AcrR family transcriptional regulator [Sporichthya sp.]|uniref:TetR/AcrR family transcriptional regulator n=1 Tax=Sporichthya sp. TaxID=65475 RepID=UPI0018553566|nr:TetR/AcrR family transcriptional regulator [Sporichthya sp.]MBA3743464.1 TetR/AcrR family transcriptional regulator [Sporichthya sp.]
MSPDSAVENAPAEKPLRSDAARNRERILAAAAEVFAARGLEATLDDIAAHAGLGIGTVYRRFPNRDALVEALFEERLAGVATMAALVLDEPDSWVALRRLLETMGAVVTADQGLFEVLICRPGGGGRAAVRETMLPIVTAVFGRAQADGHLRADVAPTDFPMMLRMLAGIGEATREVRPDLWQRYLELLLDGLRADRCGESCFTVAPIDPLDMDRVQHLGWPRR